MFRGPCLGCVCQEQWGWALQERLEPAQGRPAWGRRLVQAGVVRQMRPLAAQPAPLLQHQQRLHAIA